MSIADRLNEALAHAGKSRHWLHKALQERGDPVRGSAYASIRSYCEGANDHPPLEFLIATAEVLGVRLEWLRHGEGEPFRGEEALRSFEEEVLAEEELLDSVFDQAFLDTLEEHTKYGPSWLEGMRKVMLVAFADTWQRYSAVRGSAGEARSFSPRVGVELFRVLMRPVELAGAGKRIDLSGRDFTDYALAVLGAMNQALQVPKEVEDSETGPPTGPSPDAPTEDTSGSPLYT